MWGRREFLAACLLGCGDIAVGRRLERRGHDPHGPGGPVGWYVDSVNGDDNATGRSPATAWKTLAKLKQQPTMSLVNLARGSHWREELVGLPQGVTVQAYGTGPRPIIDGSDIALNALFTKTPGRTNVYEIPWTADFDAAGGKAAHRAWVDGLRLQRVASLDDCDNTPGSFYAPMPTGGTDTLYVHSPSSTSPLEDGRLYEFTQRLWAIQLYDHREHARIYDLTGRRNAHADGGIAIDGFAARCLAEDGRIHCFFLRGTAEDCTAWKMEPGTAIGDSTMFVAYEGFVDLAGVTFRRCKALADHPASLDSAVGFFGHTNGPTKFINVLYEDCEVEGCYIAFAFNQCQNATYRNCRSVDTNAVYGAFAFGALVIEGGTHYNRPSTTNGKLLAFNNEFGVPGSITMRRTRWMSEATEATYPIWVNVAVCDVLIEGCTIASADAGGINWFQDAASVTLRHNIFHGAFVRLGDTGEELPPYEADYNVYWFWNGAQYYGANFAYMHPKPTDVLGLPAWQALLGQDSHSIVADPLFMNEFTLAANSPARALRAGADWDG